MAKGKTLLTDIGYCALVPTVDGAIEFELSQESRSRAEMLVRGGSPRGSQIEAASGIRAILICIGSGLLLSDLLASPPSGHTIRVQDKSPKTTTYSCFSSTCSRPQEKTPGHRSSTSVCVLCTQ